MADEEEVLDNEDLFKEPAGFYQPDKPATFAEHKLMSGEVLKLRLVGHNPLWVRPFLLLPLSTSS